MKCLHILVVKMFDKIYFEYKSITLEVMGNTVESGLYHILVTLLLKDLKKILIRRVLNIGAQLHANFFLSDISRSH